MRIPITILLLFYPRPHTSSSFSISSLSPHGAGLFIISQIVHYHGVSIDLVFSIYDSTELAIQKMIEASQRMIDVNSRVGEAAAGEGRWGLNPATKRHLELQIKTLQNAPRDPDKLERLLEKKRRQKEEAKHIEHTERLVTEIEMLKVVLFLVCRNRGKEEEKEQKSSTTANKKNQQQRRRLNSQQL
jgi:hypothetical protein